nr:ribonuclease H-like domain-containing protein [Tanacetum cinerariifolium]
MNVEETPPKSMVAIDGVGFDWSYIAKDEVPTNMTLMAFLDSEGSSQNNIDDKGYWDSGCSRHMTANISYLSNFEPFDGGYVSFGQGGCKITGKGTIKTGKQHKVSCKSKLVNSVTKPLHTFHMDLFGPTSVKENQEKDKIGSKPDKNGKRGEAGKSLK